MTFDVVLDGDWHSMCSYSSMACACFGTYVSIYIYMSLIYVTLSFLFRPALPPSYHGFCSIIETVVHESNGVLAWQLPSPGESSFYLSYFLLLILPLCPSAPPASRTREAAPEFYSIIYCCFSYCWCAASPDWLVVRLDWLVVRPDWLVACLDWLVAHRLLQLLVTIRYSGCNNCLPCQPAVLLAVAVV